MNTVRSHRWGVLFVLVTCLATLGGLTASGASSNSSAAQPITILWWNGKLHESGYKAWSDAVIAEYHKLHPNVTINAVEPGGISGYETAMKTALASGGTLPDLVGLDSDAFQSQLTAAGDFLDLSPFIKADPNWQKSTKYFSIDTPLSYEYKGDVYQAPVDAGPSVVYYWKDIFKKAGIKKVPQSLSDYYALVPKLQAAGYPTLVTGLNAASNWQDDAWFWQLAANINHSWVVQRQSNNCGFKYAGDPVATKAITAFAQLYHSGVISKDSPQLAYDPDQKTAFYNRTAAMAWSSGLWLDGGFGSNIGNVGILPFPPATATGKFSLDTIPGINLSAVNVTSEQKTAAHQAAVVDFIKFLTGPFSEKEIWNTGYSLPLDPHAIGSQSDPAHALIRAESNLVHSPRFQAITELATVPQVDSALGNGLLGVLLGSETAPQVLASVDAACKQVHH